MESAVMDALDFSQQSQFTQTQPQTQQQSQPAPSASSRFPPSLWGILLSVSSSSSSSSANHDPSAPPPPGAPAGPSSRPTARVLLPRPDRLDLVKGREAYTVGRSPRCDLVLNGPKISSFQARIALGEDGVVRLEDTSTNGTFVRMRKVGKGNVTILESGDTIVFGPPADSFELEFRYVIQIDPSLSPRADPSSADADADAYDPFRLGELSQSQSQGRPAPIFAAYEVREQIGKGSFATVRKGVRRSDGRIVALKIIQKARFASNPKTMEMIEREVEIMKGLEHRFCVKCIDYFEDDQRIWLVLEYVDGGDLLDYVMKRGGLKESETREIALMVCEAVAYLHSKGITHRDLKPENLLLTRGAKPVCKVTDFGLAKMVDEGTMLKTMCGTPTYLAPEVILNPTPLAGYGSLVDAWSIGVVLYSCLTNQTPFDESESTPLPQRMRQRRVDTTVLVECGVSEVACDFLLRLLVPDPTKRMSCAEALQHPWLALKTPTPATATAAAPVAAPTTISAAALLASTLPFNDPLASPALEGDESVTRFHDEGSSRSRAGEEDGAGGGGGGAAGEGSMLLEEEDSGVDSQGFGNLRINGTNASPLPPAAPAGTSNPTHRRPPPATRPPVPPFSPAHRSTPAPSSATSEPASTKRREPMSAFSDSSLSDALDSPEPAAAAAAADAASGAPPPPAPEREPLEPAAPAEPPAAAAARRTTPARERATRSSARKGVVTPARAAAARGRARAAVAAERDGARGGANGEEDGEEEGDGRMEAERERELELEPEVGGIAAAVKSRRRKAARLH